MTGRSFAKEKRRAMQRRGFEYARDSRREMEALLDLARGTRRPVMSKAELRALAAAAVSDPAVPITRLPAGKRCK